MVESEIHRKNGIMNIVRRFYVGFWAQDGGTENVLCHVHFLQAGIDY